jgi:uncharacterized protein YbjT (DUF2867 family)
MQKILVTGGSGTLSHLVVTYLKEAGYQVHVMSRRSASGPLLPDSTWVQADLETGQGLAAAVQGMDVIMHAATSPFRHTQQIDVAGTRQLLEQARSAAISHLIYISIVGVDQIPFPYYRAKLAAEALIQESGLPWSLLRATQFHSLLDLALQGATKISPVAVLPTTLQFQPVAEGEVARRLCEMVQAGPSGRLPDMGGPAVHTMRELASSWLAWRAIRRAIIPLWLPGKSAQGFRLDIIRVRNRRWEKRRGKNGSSRNIHADALIQQHHRSLPRGRHRGKHVGYYGGTMTITGREVSDAFFDGWCGPTKRSRNVFDNIIGARLETISATAGRMHLLPNNPDEDIIRANRERRAQWQAHRNRKWYLG